MPFNPGFNVIPGAKLADRSTSFFAKKEEEEKVPQNRTFLSRVFDVLNIGSYITAGLTRGSIPGNDISLIQGYIDGVRAGNPFGQGHPEGRHLYSDVLGDLGWQPESTGGKIARGTLGFVGDVFLDPATYLTGGLSAAVKGTGKAGAKGATALSQSAAETVVKGSARAAGKTMEASEVANKVSKFQKQYDTLRGINTGARDLRWSLGGAPLGNKIFGKYADVGFTVAKADTLQKVGDATFAPAYSAARDAILGGRLGQLFSTKSNLYNLSKKNPAAVYELMEYAEHTRGLTKNMRTVNKAIKEKSKMFEDLTSDDARQVIELMEDPSKWSRVQQAVRFGDIKEAEQYRDSVRVLQGKTHKELDRLKKTYDKVHKPTDVQEGLLNRLREDYSRQLDELQGRHIEDRGQLNEMIKAYENEAAVLGRKIDDPPFIPEVKHSADADEVLSAKSKGTSAEEALDSFNKYDVEESAHRKYMKGKGKKPEGHKLSKFEDADIDPSEKAYLPLQPSEDVAPSFNKIKAVEDISDYLFGNPKYISHTVNKEDLREVAYMIGQGKRKGRIIDFVRESQSSFTSRDKSIYNWIGERMGYGDLSKTDAWGRKVNQYSSWDEMFHKRWDDLQKKKIKEPHKWGKDDELLEAELWELKRERDGYLEKLDKARNSQEVRKIQQEFADEDAARIYEENYEKYYEGKRDGFIDSDDARGGRGRHIDEGDVEMHPRYDHDEFNLTTPSERMRIQRDVTNEMLHKNPNIKPQDVSSSHLRWVKNVGDEAEEVMHEMFRKPYHTLSDGQQKLVRNKALQRAKQKSTGDIPSKEVLSTPEKEKIARHAQEKTNQLRRQTFDGMVREGGYVNFSHQGKIKRGIIDEINIHPDESLYAYAPSTRDAMGSKRLNITTKDGEVVSDVGLEQLRAVDVDNRLLSFEELSNMSHNTRSFIKRQNELTQLVEKGKNKLHKLDTDYETLMNKVREKQAAVEKRIMDAEAINEESMRALYNGEYAKYEGLLDESHRIEKALADDDAMETFLRQRLGDGEIDEVLARNSIDTGEVVLNSNLSIDEKVRTIAESFRKELIKIGESEVAIGKLKQEQFDNFMLDYLPHKLTDAGRKVFDTHATAIKKYPAMGDDLGFGRKFNPYSKTRHITEITDAQGNIIHNPNVIQLNEWAQREYGHILKGKNAFSEDLADIYISRALQNTELLYDDAYMRNMMNVFGKEYTGEALEEGYSLAVNYGMFKETAHSVAKLNRIVDVSEATSAALRQEGVMKSLEGKAFQKLGAKANDPAAFKKAMNDEVVTYIEEFLRKNYPADVQRKMFEDNLHKFSEFTGTGKKLDDMATPMIEVDGSNVAGIHQMYDETIGRFTAHIKKSLANFRKNQLVDTRQATKEKMDAIDLQVEKMDMDEVLRQVEDLKSTADEVDLGRLNRLSKKVDTFKKTPSPAEARQINKAIMQKANQARKIQIAKDQHEFLNLYDKMLHWIKLSQTAVMPSFHGRNKLTNDFNSALKIGNDVLDVDFQRKAWRTIRNKGDVDGVMKIEYPDGTTSSISWRELYEEGLNHDAIGAGFFAKEFSATTESHGVLRRMLKRLDIDLPGKYDPTDTRDFIWFQKGKEIGGAIEGQSRLMHFASEVSRGMSFEDAAASSRRFLFDYSDLTAFEQNVMKRIFPYYTWMRKNAPLQFEMLLDNPNQYRYAAKIMNGIEGMVDEEDRMNRGLVEDFAKDWIQTPFTTADDRNVLLNPTMPFMDFSRLPDPTSAGTTFDRLFPQMSPLITTPVEQIANRNFFFDSPIVYDGQSQVGQRLDHAASQIAPYSAAKGLSSRRGSDLGLQALHTLTGVRAINYDYDRFKARKIQELVEKGEDLPMGR